MEISILLLENYRLTIASVPMLRVLGYSFPQRFDVSEPFTRLIEDELRRAVQPFCQHLSRPCVHCHFRHGW